MQKKHFAGLIFILAAVLTILSGISAFADIPSPNRDFYYYDEADILSEETEYMLYANGEALKKACGAQIVVLVVNGLDGMTIYDYAYAVINEWGVGDKEEKNGVVLVIDEMGGEYRMTIGYGLETYMTSASVQKMLDEYFHQLFCEYKTELAVRNLYEKLFYEICGFYDVELELITEMNIEENTQKSVFEWLKEMMGGRKEG